jgi:fucose 4-O-acetylase-like acetyltransferase
MSQTPRPGRQPLLDVVKAIAIWLVVLGHNETIRLEHPQWYRAIYLVHMPAFLIATGMVTPPMHDAARLLDRLRALMQPFMVAWLLWLPLAWHRQDGDGLALIGGLLWMNGYGLYNQPTWYLGVLSCGLVLLWAWDQWPASPRLKALLALGLVVLGLCVVPQGRRAAPWIPGVSASSVGWPWGLDLALLIVPLLLLGRRLRAASDRLGDDALLAVLACGLGVALFTLAFAQGGFLDLNARMVSQPLWCVAATLSGCLALWGLAGVLCRWLRGRARDGIAAVGRSTLFILLFHAPIQNVIAKGLPALGVDAGLGAVGLSFAVVIGLWWVDARCVARVPLLHALFRPSPRPRR